MSIIFRRRLVFLSRKVRRVAFTFSIPTRSIRTFAAVLSLTATTNWARSRLVRLVTLAVRPAVIWLSSTRSDTIELIGDSVDAGLEPFPKQIADGVAGSGFGFLLAKRIRREHKGHGQNSEPHAPIFAATHSLSRA